MPKFVGDVADTILVKLATASAMPSMMPSTAAGMGQANRQHYGGRLIAEIVQCAGHPGTIDGAIRPAFGCVPGWDATLDSAGVLILADENEWV